MKQLLYVCVCVCMEKGKASPLYLTVILSISMQRYYEISHVICNTLFFQQQNTQEEEIDDVVLCALYVRYKVLNVCVRKNYFF